MPPRHIDRAFRNRTRVIGIILLALLTIVPLFAATPKVTPGQMMKITVADHPEFSQSVLVRQDGTTEYPLLAGVPLGGLTVSEVRALLLPILLRYEREPEVFIVLSEQKLVRFQVYGAVHSPGKYESEAPLNLQQALRMAGGPLPESEGGEVRILRIIDDQRIDIPVDLSHYFEHDSLRLAPEIIDGDIIVQPNLSDATKVRVLGMVQSPLAYAPRHGENVLDAINRSGGFAANSDRSRVKHISRVKGQRIEQTIDIQDYINDGRIDAIPLVLPGDTIVVPEEAEWRSTRFWILLVRDLTLLLSSAVILSRLY